MSWLDEIKRGYKFQCSNCNTIVHKGGLNVPADIIDKVDGMCKYCEACECYVPFKYVGFYNAEKIGISHSTVKREYSQNGRRAYKIGNTYMSKSKHDYLETGEINSGYTPQYQAHLEKESEKNEYLLKTETNQNRAGVSGIDGETQKKLDKQVADLPDGEYSVTIDKPSN